MEDCHNEKEYVRRVAEDEEVGRAFSTDKKDRLIEAARMRRSSAIIPR